MASHSRRGGEGATGNGLAVALTDVLQRMIEDAARQQIEGALRLQEQEVERRIQEAVGMQEQRAAAALREALCQMEQQLQERDEVIGALRHSLSERMHRLEARMTQMEVGGSSSPERWGIEETGGQRRFLEQNEALPVERMQQVETKVGSHSAREGKEAGGQEGALEQLEARMTAIEERVAREGRVESGGQEGVLEARMRKLEEAVQRALTRVFPRVEALLAQLEEASPPEAPRASALAAAEGPAAGEERRQRQMVELRMREARAKGNRAAAAPSSLGEDLCEAAFEGRVEDVRRLLDCGADVNYTNAEGCTPLISAFYHRAQWGTGKPNVVSLLLERGADVNAVEVDGWSALHCAAHVSASARAVTALLGAGADASARDADGATPLHWAARNGSEVGVVALLAAGAGKSIRCWGGDWVNKAPFDLAVSNAIWNLLRL